MTHQAGRMRCSGIWARTMVTNIERAVVWEVNGLDISVQHFLIDPLGTRYDFWTYLGISEDIWSPFLSEHDG